MICFRQTEDSSSSVISNVVVSLLNLLKPVAEMQYKHPRPETCPELSILNWGFSWTWVKYDLVVPFAVATSGSMEWNATILVVLLIDLTLQSQIEEVLLVSPCPHI